MNQTNLPRGLTLGFLSTDEQWKNQLLDHHNDDKESTPYGQDPIGKFKWWLDLSNDFIKQFVNISENEIIEKQSLLTKLMIANISADFVTCNAETLQPSSRKIICKEINDEGFTFFTNGQSRKGIDIETNNKVALNFMFTLPIIRQVRVEGIAHKVSREKVIESYQNEVPEYRVNINTCPQSDTCEIGREGMWEKFDENSKKDLSQCPDYWCGYIVKPVRFEFYQEGLHRMADRIVYEKSNDSTWNSYIIYP